jgi:hypothetical protein
MECPPAPEVCAFSTGDDFLVFLGFDDVNVGWYAAAMIIMILFLRFLAFFGLRFCHRS